MNTVGPRPSPWLAGLDVKNGGSVPQLAKIGRLRGLVAVLAQRHRRQPWSRPMRSA